MGGSPLRFKKLFGSEPNKDLLIDFLNELLRGQKQIKTLTYAKNEHLGQTDEYRKAVFDLYCENEEGEKFIIWLYLLKNLHRFTDIPAVLQERIFRKVFEIAEVSKLNKEDMNTYEQSLKDKRDWKNAMDTLIEESIEKGMRKSKIDLIKAMKAKGYDLNEISELTNIPVEEIEKL